MSIEWTSRPGAVNRIYSAKTALGTIEIKKTNFRNIGSGWLIRFPNGKDYRAESVETAKLYAEDWLKRNSPDDH